MSTIKDPKLRVLELAEGSDYVCYEKVIIAPASWIGFDEKKKQLTVRYAFPPEREGEDDTFFKDIFKNRVSAPDSWTSYPISKDLGEANTLREAQQILKEHNKKVESKLKEAQIEEIAKTPLDLADIPSLTQHPTLFAQETMRGSEINGNFLQAIENETNHPHLSPSKQPASKGSGTGTRQNKRKLRPKQTNKKNEKKLSPKKSRTMKQKENGGPDTPEESEQDVSAVSIDNPGSIIISKRDEFKSDDSSATFSPELEKTVENTCTSSADKAYPSESAVNTEIVETNGNSPVALTNTTTNEEVLEINVSPIQMDTLATRKDINDLKEWISQRFNSQSQQIAGNSTALNEVKNTLKNQNSAAGGQNYLLLDDLKKKYNLVLPFTELKQFEDFDDSLSGLAIRRDLGSYFSIMINSEKDGRTSIREIMKAFCRKVVLHDNYVALQASEDSRKKAFIETQFGKLLYENVRVKTQLSDALVRDSFSKVMLSVKDWEGGRAERKKKSIELKDQE